MKKRCTALRKDGNGCQAWAVAGTDPPRCAAHRRARTTAAGSDGGDGGNWQPTGRPPGSEAIDDVIADLAEKQRRLSELIEEALAQDEAGLGAISRLFALHGQNASRLGRLLRDRQALTGETTDRVLGSIAQALDELSVELGVDL
jgi:hypothetical protein